MKKMTFLWEAQSGPLILDPSKRVVLYARGSYSPPHKHHFASIKEVLDANHNHPNLRVVIDQLAFTTRHGVPKSTAKRIWELFIKHLLPGRDIWLCDGTFLKNDELFHKATKNADLFVFLRGDESEDHARVQSHFMNGYRHTIQKLKHRGLESLFFFGIRRGVSATEFVKALIAGRRDRHRKADEIGHKYLPAGLPSYVMHEILRSLWACYLQV